MNNKYNKWSSIEIRWDSKRFACFEPSGSAKERRRRPGHQGRCRICFPKSLSKSARMKNKNTHADYRGIANSFTRSIKAYCHPSIFTSLSTLICIDCSPCLTPRKPSKAGSIHCRCRVSHCCLHLRHPIPHGRAFIQVEPPLQPVSRAIVEFEVNEDAFNLLHQIGITSFAWWNMVMCLLNSKLLANWKHVNTNLARIFQVSQHAKS